MRRSARAAIAVAVLRHPRLWPTAARQARRVARRGWWRRPPFLPLPDPLYLRFRLLTMYGDAEQPPDAEALRTYLEWCRDFPSPGARSRNARARSGGTR